MTQDYFDKYREKRNSLIKLNNEYELKAEIFKKETEEFEKNSTQLRHELRSMRSIISTMIEEGIDSTEAILREQNIKNDNEITSFNVSGQLAVSAMTIQQSFDFDSGIKTSVGLGEIQRHSNRNEIARKV